MALTNHEKWQYLQLKKMKISRESMEYFTTWTFPEYEVNWHHRLIFNTLDRFIYTNEINRLMICTGPRHGKTEIVSRRLPAFIFGLFPNDSIIAASYSDDLASSNNRDVQRIIESEKYQLIFPFTRLSQGRDGFKRTNDLFEIVNHSGYYRSAGVGGGITGKGANWLLLDDLVKNQDEADSPTFRKKIWDWYTSTAYTRLEKNAKIILIMTRWHEDDIAGRLLQLQKKDPLADKWTVLNLPVVCESPKDSRDPRKIGEALWPNKYDEKTLATMKATVGMRVWNGLFQQRPSAAEGGIFKRHLWKFYERLPEKFDKIIQSWDLTFKKKDDNDFVAGHILGKVGANIYLLDRVHARMSFTESLSALESMSKKWPEARTKWIEAKANGDALVDMLKDKVPGLILVEPKGGKLARANAITPYHEAGNLFLPSLELCSWVADFIEEHANFPNDAHDDDVDAFSQGVTNLMGDPREKLRKLLGGV